MHINFRYFALLLLGLTYWQGSQAQYSLHEAGMDAGAGLLSLQNQGAFVGGPDVGINGWYSHYFCGKRYGIHAEAGIRYAVVYAGNSESAFANTDERPVRLQFGNADAGFYFKIRKNTFHRRKEWAVMAGLKTRIRYAAHRSVPTTSTELEPFTSELPRVLPGAHLSLWLRRPLGKELHWFLQPGVEYFFVPVMATPTEGNFNGLHLFLRVGLSLWDFRG